MNRLTTSSIPHMHPAACHTCTLPPAVPADTHPPRVGPAGVVDGEGGVSRIGGKQVTDEGRLAQAWCTGEAWKAALGLGGMSGTRAIAAKPVAALACTDHSPASCRGWPSPPV